MKDARVRGPAYGFHPGPALAQRIEEARRELSDTIGMKMTRANALRILVQRGIADLDREKEARP